MLFMPSNITKRGATYYFRARVPTHLVKAYGRSHVSLSLHTQDKAEARARAQERSVELRRELQALEDRNAKTSPGTGTVSLHLTDAEIDHLCTRYRANALAEDEIARIKTLSPERMEVDVDFLELALPDMRKAFAAGDLTPVHPSLRQFLKSIDVTVPRQSPSYQRLALRFQQAELEVHEALLQRRRGVAVPIPVLPTDNLGLDDVLRCWKNQATSRDPKTARAFELAFEMFAKSCSAPSARLIRKADAVQFRNTQVASGAHKGPTIGRHLSFLRAAFQCAVNDGLLEANPFDGVKVAAASGPKKKARRPFSIEQLNRIFSGPVYQPTFVPRPSLGDACRWLPLLSLFHGARLEEMAQLRKSDIRQDPTHGAYISINAEDGKRLKTSSSMRNVPLHPVLHDLGFLDYVKGQKGPRLFPALRPDKYGILSTQFSTWFGRYLDSLGISDPGLVFHSARHSFIQECKDKADVIPPEVREAMVGHLSEQHIARVYGDALYPLAPQVAALKRVQFAGLDLRCVAAALRKPRP